MSKRGSVVLHGILACLCALVLLAPPAATAGDDQCTKELCIDRSRFYEGFRKFNRDHPLAQDHKKLSERSFDAMQDMLNHWDTSEELTDTRWLAYVISTVFWETGGFLYPVREGLCDDEPCAIKHLEELWRKRLVRQRYWDPDATTGQSYYGRGQVQLTHLVNYWRVGSELTQSQDTDQFADLDRRLVSKPDLALKDWLSTAALFDGMVHGWFNAEFGRGLAVYINEDAPSDHRAYMEARRTVNGFDKREMLADFAVEIHKFIKVVPASAVSSVNTDTVTDSDDEADNRRVVGIDDQVTPRNIDDIDEGVRVGPEPEEPEAPEPPSDAPIDFEHPVRAIVNLTGVVAGGVAFAAEGKLRTPPTKKELRQERKRKRKRERRLERRRRKQERQQEKNER